jgi:tetratricopeptide (TPR) repeat protein
LIRTGAYRGSARPLTSGFAVVLVTALAVTGCGLRGQKLSRFEPRSDGPPPVASMAQTIESLDSRLSGALLQAAVLPSASVYRQVAREYRRVGVLDQAHEYFTRAVRLEPTDAVSYEGLARIWRDWGTPALGLADAYRAVHYAPDSPSAANTLGTLLQALGYVNDAKTWYTRALTLDPQAWYALNNLCYALIMTRELSIDTCKAAVAAAPEEKSARNNLALAHAAAGDLEQARSWFRRAGDTAEAHYNYGITLMARREYAQAVEEFKKALALNPAHTQAVIRARQARVAAAGIEQKSEETRP